ncbi:AAA family ATPase [Chromatium weissei]|nr:AAA family ATPase [Chromatium weissei]
MYRKAERKQAKLRLALCGPSGSGKTYSALLIAQGLQPNKVALIDTERGSGELYADLIPYDVASLNPPYTPQRYIDLIHGAEKAGYDVLIIDSISHAWMGTGGILEMHDKVATATRNAFTAWRDVTPKHNALVDAIIGADLHVIVTTRSKTSYDMVEDNGKKKPVKIGLAPVQREGLEYEFTTVFDLSVGQHVATATKDRTGLFDNQHFIPTVATGSALRDWLMTGIDPTEESHKTLALFKANVSAMDSISHLTNWWRKHSTEIAMLTAPDREFITAHCAQHKAALTALSEPPKVESEPPKPNGIDHAEAVTH